jgi:hypothetical protein
MTPTKRSLPILLITLALLAAACDGQEPAGASDAEAAEFRAAVDGLCQTASSLGQNKVSEALKIFGDRSHAYLHELADDLAKRDRAAAAKLLETKQAVEIALRDPSFYGRPEIARRFRDLHNTLLRAAKVMGLPQVGCGA